MTSPRLLRRTFAVTVVALSLSGYSTVHAQPASGAWKASTAFGELGFTVNSDGTKVTKIILDVRNWSCGPVSGSWTTTSYWADPLAGWPISNGQFAIILNGSISGMATKWTVNGTFSSTGNETSGTWSFSISGTTSSGNWGPVGPVLAVENDNGFPDRFELEQNYPNPFNPSTTIKYELPKASEVRLSVYDKLGHELSTLVNERREAGVHEVKFDAAGLSSGVYFYRLQAGDFVQLKKLVLLK